MKTNRLLAVTAGALLTLWSCNVKDPIYETDHPGQGKIMLTVDWTDRGEEVGIPSAYTVRMGEYNAVLSDRTNTLDHLFTPATYRVYLYNTTDNITVNGVAATAGYASGALGWLFTGTESLTVEGDKDHDFTVAMHQQVRLLNIELTVVEGDPGGISSVSAVLTGIAGRLDMETGEHTGQGVEVKPVFTRTGNKLRAAVRLLGMTGDDQKLMLNIMFTDGRTQAVESDLGRLLSGFNTGKRVPLDISADLHIPVEIGFAVTITGWKSVQNSGGIAW